MIVKGLFNRLQTRIFIAMLLLLFAMSALIILVAVNQYKQQAEDYHLNRLDRKENAIKRDMEYHLQNTTFFQETDKLPVIFRDKIFEMSHVHNLEIGIYDLKGKLLISSRATFDMDSLSKSIANDVVTELKNDINHRVVKEQLLDGQKYMSIFAYIYDNSFTPIGILNIPYLGETDFYKDELEQLLVRISFVLLFALLFAVVLAYYSSKRISDPINEIVEKMKQFRINKRNEKLPAKANSQEVKELIEAYNDMVVQLEKSADKLAQSERENAWREMAKQVAHEIKNPLTPMRLSIQNFERKFDPKDPDIQTKVKDISDALIAQIDTMSSIANAFSDFAKMPTANIQSINLHDVVEDTVRVFQDDHITFEAEKGDYQVEFDATQLIRVINNLVSNALYATKDLQQPKVNVKLQTTSEHIIIAVHDNGAGIPIPIQNKIFEPKFTTKSSGMGLGLPMVKNILENYKANITFSSEENKGTTFTVTIPKN